MISIDVIKELRVRTDVPIGACKKALEETGGDLDKAIAVLQKAGTEFAAKKSVRKTGFGLIEAYVHATGAIGVLLELRCETDFVARNPEYKKLAHDIAMHIAAVNPDSVSVLLEQDFIKDPGVTIKKFIELHIAKFGENIQVSQFKRIEL
jgi:elongation factor Ts